MSKMFQRVAFLASIVISTQHLIVSGFSASPLTSKRIAPRSITVLNENNGSGPSSAAAKAAELKQKAEDAKRKAQELRSVAEAKAAAAMEAVKQVNDNVDNEAQTSQVIAQETLKMNAQSEDVKESRSKASSRVVISDGAIIPINESTIEFTAGVIGGTAALVLGGGPIFAVVAAAAANYLSRKDDLGEINELIQGISRASLETFNWFAKLDSKYRMIGKLQESLDESLNKLKNSGGENAETIANIEKSIGRTTKQLQELAVETDFFEGAKQALGAVGDVLETSVDKAASANQEYKLTERASGAVKKAIEKVKSSE